MRSDLCVQLIFLVALALGGVVDRTHCFYFNDGSLPSSSWAGTGRQSPRLSYRCRFYGICQQQSTGFELQNYIYEPPSPPQQSQSLPQYDSRSSSNLNNYYENNNNYQRQLPSLSNRGGYY